MESKTKSLCLVAHPDDCIIFGYGYIMNNPSDWVICYLTNNRKSARGLEIKNFWDKRKIETMFLEYLDLPSDRLFNTVSFDKKSAKQDIDIITSEFDLVLTHNSAGEYGHPHHKFINQAVEHKNVIEFSYPNEGETMYWMPKTSYDLNLLPQHKSAIEHFQKQDQLVYGYNKR